ncbi:MAG: chemotaxis protein CheR [Planctomycetota bacterium]|nr:MAG: chemotaxis protein CheR [Planctomycetota bacterium]
MNLSKEELQFLFDLIFKKSAIVLNERKDYLIYNRLTPLLKLNNISTLSDLTDELKRDNQDLASQVVDALTTNETLFFRDLRPFDMLKDHIIPSILENNIKTKNINIWSSACSTGQEPYSIKMMLLENFPQLSDWKINIFATDISDIVLDQAREGVYSQAEVNRGLPIKMLVKYFENKDGKWFVKDLLKENINFKNLNFVDKWPEIPPMDIILVRNVLIYFNRERKQDILKRLCNQLSNNGKIILGSSETIIGLDIPLECEIFEKSCFYKLKEDFSK